MTAGSDTMERCRLNVLIVDDEERACVNLNNMLIEYIDPALNIAGICHSTEEAEQEIRAKKPDAVFLDIEMPYENAFHFLDRIAPIDFEVVFVTAFDEYAIKAFKLNAVDYILKPISITELQRAVTRLCQRIAYRRLAAKTQVSYTNVSNQIINKTAQDKLLLRDLTSIEVVAFRNVLFVEAQGSYSRVVFLKDDKVREMVVSTYLSDFEELLPADMFLRVHRSYVLNTNHVHKIKKDAGEIVLQGNHIIPVSRRRYPALMSAFKKKQQ